jgi:molybdopterin-containing oxidoreductase family iron-sulfur binding subunit
VTNFTPPGVFWGRLLKAETGSFPVSLRQGLPVLCMQCKEPECKKVCPTKATSQHEDGIVTIDKNLCVGCKYCIVACPYGARYFVGRWQGYFKEPPEPFEKVENPFEIYAKRQWQEKRGEGTATKCDFCIERVQLGGNPACVDTCPAKARYFGDLDDPESEVSRLIKTQRGFQLNPEFGTNPSVYYLPPR